MVSPKLLRYAERVVRRYDVNKDGRLGEDEWRAMHGKPALADSNRDGRITIEELAQHIANFGAGRAIRLSTSASGPLAGNDLRDANSPTLDRLPGEGASPLGAEASAAAPAGDPRRNLKYFAALPAGVPQWYVDRDTDGDGQLTLAEYSPKLLRSEIDDFGRLDLNRDGLLTVREYLRAAKESKSATTGTDAGQPVSTP